MPHLDQRKIDLLNQIVHQYILSGSPVGSVALVQHYRLSDSSASIRNCMALLEEEGYMYQPHTSAGRVPTEEGYLVYVQHLKVQKISVRHQNLLAKAAQAETERRARLKELARTLAELSGEMVFLAFDEQNVYYTGLHTLSEKPEFWDRDLFAEISQSFDHSEDTVARLLETLGDEPEVRVGASSCFGRQCSTVAMRLSERGVNGLIGMVGPMRMDYARNLALLESMKEFFEN